MFRPRPSRAAIALALASVAALAAACGEEIQVEPGRTAVVQGRTVSLREGAELFNERCSGCHSLDAAASRGSKPEDEAEVSERTDGPSFNVRPVELEDALFAIRNGGFSGAIMPANIVVGEDALAVAAFLDEFSGREAGEEGSQRLGPGAPGER